MDLVVKAICRLRGVCRRVKSAWRLRRFVLAERSFLKSLQIGARVVFHVPVRSGGIGSLRIGNGNALGWVEAPMLGNGGILLQPRSRQAEIRIGDSNTISNNVVLIANESISIGNNCQIGDQVAIYDCDFHEINPATRVRSPGPTQPVTIGNNVWIGSRAIVLKGVSIGDNSVIGAMSLVTRSIPANCIAAGNPAKVIRLVEEQTHA